jgi:cyclophilin family peptidyl-prolyl cis-trans isomerase
MAQVFIDTDRGTIQIELAVVDAPFAVETFVTLARKGFYDGLTFHRVVPDFVIQGGDPRGDGEGGPGFTIRDELSQRPYLRGVVGIALDWEDNGASSSSRTRPNRTSTRAIRSSAASCRAWTSSIRFNRGK